MRLVRIGVASAAYDPIEEIAERLSAAVPELKRGAIALVDSPRVPNNQSCQRDLDCALRSLIGRINRPRAPGERIRLSMFPTPRDEYFFRCARDAGCKPHLAAIARTLFPSVHAGAPEHAKGRGWLFTRFMLAGFAAHRALERIGAESIEAYPYLAFSLWKKPAEALPPKSESRAALDARQAIVGRLARRARVKASPPDTMDEADAAVLALTFALAEPALVLESDLHGRFLLPLTPRDMAAVALDDLARA